MLEYLINDNIVDKSDRIAVGVSGGADSMLLLWALIDKQKQTGFYFEVININHHIYAHLPQRKGVIKATLVYKQINQALQKEKIPSNPHKQALRLDIFL